MNVLEKEMLYDSLFGHYPVKRLDRVTKLARSLNWDAFFDIGRGNSVYITTEAGGGWEFASPRHAEAFLRRKRRKNR